ncbi:ATP-dependent helicase [Aeromicrobium sp. Leaf272]|uniref:ATP-dependent helicase n=1 Tax=Aeromicrobium sp. Leaf272 TaxID=1736317 RepID=UPI000ABF10C3|nr:ATP-dependent helicase [Aeromicrobium sp. Leaf272]
MSDPSSAPAPGSDPLSTVAPATREWFEGAFSAPTPAQAEAWAGIAERKNVLVVAPTGSGKTLAAFLSAIDRLLHEPTPEKERRTRVLYISPLKALAVDVERNLRSPLVGITQVAARRGDTFSDVRVGVRSGDTSARDRRSLVTSPPDILITTPESLFLMLTSAARETLRGVDTVIIDEIHAVAGTKRGAHLALSLERLDDLLDEPARRVGLSATVRPHDEVARFLGGRAPVHVVAPPSPSRLELDVVVPLDDMTELSRPPSTDADEVVRDEGSGARSISDPLQDDNGGSIWPFIEHDVVERILSVRSTIVFCNSRGQAERLTAHLNELWSDREARSETSGGSRLPPASVGGVSGTTSGRGSVDSRDPDDVGALARAHHGSVSKEQRALIEDDLKSGRLRCVVATSSLELGIDMGAVDLVVQMSTPPSVASGLQRVGRAGHQVGEVSRGLVYPTTRHDLVGAAVTAERMREGAIERLSVPANPLDVLAQQTVAACALEPLEVEAWFDVVRRSAPFAALPRSAYEATLDLLAGRYPSDRFAELRPRVVWDRDAGTITGRPGAQRLAVTSGGTIPDRGLFAVVLADGIDEGPSKRVGELDEEMVYESRVGDVFALGATSWRIQEITHDRVIVTPAFGEPARLPFWRGDAAGRPAELGEAIGAFVRRVSEGTAPEHLDERARFNLMAFLDEQREAMPTLPTDRTLVVERFHDELGDWRVVLHSPYGRRVHAPWALVVAARVLERYGVDGSVVATDDGIVARIPDTSSPWAPDDATSGPGGGSGPWAENGTDVPGADLFVLDVDDLERVVTAEVGGSALFASRFRECAARALLLPRRNPGARAPLWQQRQRAAQLLDVAREHPDFPILLETARECLQDVYDLPALTTLAERVAQQEVRIVEVETSTASPFARTLLFGYVATFLYEGDTPLAERRAAALSLDPTLLSELLGRAELRELLDPEVLERTEAELQRLADDRRLKGTEGAADLLRLLGPLTTAEVDARLVDDAVPALEELQDARRVVELPVAGEPRWVVVEDAGRLRDALGVVVPLGIPDALLQQVADPLGDLVSRYARTHGPFTAEEVATRFGLGRAVVLDVLSRLTRDDRLVEGEFRPGASGTEHVDVEVLRRLRSRSLAAARQQIEPVDPRTFARFLPSWQEVGGSLRGLDGVLTVVDQLAGVPLPASAWESLVLPSRVRDYSPAQLDELLGAGEVVWTGAGTLAGSDGWVQLHPADLVLPARRDPVEPDALGLRLLELLDDGGAYLFRQLTQALAADEKPPGDDAVVEALWQLVWSGRVAGDSYAPVRARLGGRGAHRSRGGSTPRARVRARRGMAASPRAARLGPPIASGRWFAVERPGDDPQQQAALQVARTEALVARHGVVTRGAVVAEQTPGGFAGAYRVLRELEQNGSVLRGYYIDSLGAAQFASVATVDRMRTFERPDDERADVDAVVLAATDPAQPFGAALPWPAIIDPADDLKHRPARKAGALVALHDGRAVLYVERGGRSCLAFTDDADVLARAAHALAALGRSGRIPRLTVESVNGRPSGSSPTGEALLAAGFERHPKGLRLDLRRGSDTARRSPSAGRSSHA